MGAEESTHIPLQPIITRQERRGTLGEPETSPSISFARASRNKDNEHVRNLRPF